MSAGLTEYWLPPPHNNENGLDGDNDKSAHQRAVLRRQQRAGVSIGTGMSGVREIANVVRLMDITATAGGSGYRKLPPYFVPSLLGNAAASRVSLRYGLHGPNWTATTACAASSHAIGDAARCIQAGTADIMMLAGGAESCLDPLSVAGFARLRALSTAYNHDPAAASRPFDAARDGFDMGEAGACVLVLEELEHAVRRLGSGSAS